jgi:hypothetical protein
MRVLQFLFRKPLPLQEKILLSNTSKKNSHLKLKAQKATTCAVLDSIKVLGLMVTQMERVAMHSMQTEIIIRDAFLMASVRRKGGTYSGLKTTIILVLG